MKDEPTEGRIAISEDKKLAIFGSPFGFAGPVIQQYEPFANEAEAITAATVKIREMGLPIHPEIFPPAHHSHSDDDKQATPQTKVSLPSPTTTHHTN